MTLKTFSVLTLVMLSFAGQAATSEPLTATDSQTAESWTQSLRTQAGQWGLSMEEYQRYQQLMHGPRGIQSPGLDPLTTLGIEANNEAERRHYAEQWVKAEFARTEKELRFQREVNAAWKRLFPDTLPVNMEKGGETNGRLALFVRGKNCPQCDSRLAAVLAANQPVDIYLVDSGGDDNTLRQWAKGHHIPVERVRNRQVTLNHDAGHWLRFGNGVMPVLLRQGEQGWQVTSL
ncbi:TIGR03759 family integrating conjugative element protein [Xenorhabdus bovienii]|uniref:TIGR03759 family integrating conjugative element protein n=1 Tax=Xenorhabdus bovienii TaxID=40576 RepID=UPI003DA64EBC